MNDNKDKDLEKALFDDERISQFLQGKMSPAEESAFLDKLNRDKILRERAVIQARLVKGMKQADEEMIELLKQADLQDIYNTLGIRQKKSPVRWWAVAASIVFIIFAGFKSYDYYDTTRLGMRYAETFPISTVIQRGSSDADVEKELTTLFNNIINRKDLATTTDRLSQLWEISEQETYNDYTDYSPYIGWYLAIGYLEDYEKEKAKAILIQLKQIHISNTVYKDKIDELLFNIE